MPGFKLFKDGFGIGNTTMRLSNAFSGNNMLAKTLKMTLENAWWLAGIAASSLIDKSKADVSMFINTYLFLGVNNSQGQIISYQIGMNDITIDVSELGSQFSQGTCGANVSVVAAPLYDIVNQWTCGQFSPRVGVGPFPMDSIALWREKDATPMPETEMCIVWVLNNINVACIAQQDSDFEKFLIGMGAVAGGVVLCYLGVAVKNCLTEHFCAEKVSNEKMSLLTKKNSTTAVQQDSSTVVEMSNFSSTTLSR